MTTFRFGMRHGTALLGIGLLIIGLTLGAYATYQLGWGSSATAAQARQENGQIRQTWRHERLRPRPRVQPTTGQPLALLRVPALGLEYEVAVVHGVDDPVIDRGLVGHFPGTALPGEVGNFAVAGHRVTHGEPFRHLDRLRPGDPVVVETPDATYTYVVDNDPRRTIVGPNDTWVTDPVPGARPDTRPEQALLTVTTCASLWNSQQRMVVFGHLVAANPKQPSKRHGE